MSDTPPDHLSVNPRSPHFDMETLQRGIGGAAEIVRSEPLRYPGHEGCHRVAQVGVLDEFLPVRRVA